MNSRRRPSAAPAERFHAERNHAERNHAERLQKLLSAAGVGSRREVERWIKEGRVHINGKLALLGAKLGERDRVTLDGRLLRLRAAAAPVRAPPVVLFHRSPGEPLNLQAAVARAAEALQLPRSRTRWLAVQPLPPVDGGLELLTADGSWAHRISQGIQALTMDYVLRMRGRLDGPLIEEFRAATDGEDAPMCILRAEPQYGAGLNHWLNVTVRATRTAQVRHWWAARGLVVSRLMRVRFGPVHLGRDLPRGHSRAMLAAERNALMSEVSAAKAARLALSDGDDSDPVRPLAQ